MDTSQLAFDDRPSLRAALVFTVFVLLGCGLLYELAGTAIGRVLFPHQAQGSLIERDGHIVGSALVAQPFADAGISQFASSLSVSDRFHIDTDGVTTKRVLRHGFAGVLPESIVQRSKRSFPLPFREWIASASDVLRESEVVRTWIKPEIVDAISDQPAQHWRLAWPIMNLAIWGERMFGDTGVLERMHSTNTTTVSR